MPGVMSKPRRSPTLSHLVATLFGVGAGLSRFLTSLFRSRSALVAENLFLRKQLAFYREREIEPQRLTDSARVCLVVWSRLFNWREALLVVKPETLIAWHRKGFRLFCTNHLPKLGFWLVGAAESGWSPLLFTSGRKHSSWIPRKSTVAPRQTSVFAASATCYLLIRRVLS